MQNEMNSRLIVGDYIKNDVLFYVGLSLTLLGILPNYCYFVTIFAIPFFLMNAFVDLAGLLVSSIGIFIWALSAISIFLWPMAVVMVVFWEIILIPLELISPITLTTGIVLLYVSMT